jgi:hypothetical protein
VQPSEGPCPITWRQEPPTPAQRAAWRQLWARLLSQPVPETRQPQDWAGPRATYDDDQDGTDQAAPTTSTSPHNKRRHHDRV